MADREFISYKVKKGDNLTGIAQALTGRASRFREIAEVNGVRNPDYIRAGDVISVPKDMLREDWEERASRSVQYSNPGKAAPSLSSPSSSSVSKPSLSASSTKPSSAAGPDGSDPSRSSPVRPSSAGLDGGASRDASSGKAGSGTPPSSSSYSMSDEMKDLIRRHESFVDHAYEDVYNKGMMLAGYGSSDKDFVAKASKGKVTREEAERQLDKDVAREYSRISSLYPDFKEYPGYIQDVLVEAAYNAGAEKVKNRSPRLNKALEQEDWLGVALEADYGVYRKGYSGHKKRWLDRVNFVARALGVDELDMEEAMAERSRRRRKVA